MEKNSKIYVAGHRGMVGSAIVRELQRQGYTNIITRTHKELDLTRQDAVETFFAQEKPVFVSEFGAGAVAGRFGEKTEKWTEEYQAEVYRKTLAMYDRIPGFAGCTPWILMDFRSPRRQNHDTQNFFNRKGVVSERGQTKQAFYVLQDFYKKKGAFKKK